MTLSSSASRDVNDLSFLTYSKYAYTPLTWPASATAANILSKVCLCKSGHLCDSLVTAIILMTDVQTIANAQTSAYLHTCLSKNDGLAPPSSTSLAPPSVSKYVSRGMSITASPSFLFKVS
eukprot:GHVT01082352.1.p2 GENE.GHVT01082352.1~~GHVT01082352.1.p2  ORF type:complete len:121 (-),score=6.31 GHVT01082352.1:133-495(-)